MQEDKKRVLAIDYGDKNIGLAITDPLGIMAVPLLTIVRKDIHTIKPYVAQIGEIIKENNVGLIVVGLPKNMNGTLGERAEITQDFAERLSRNFKKVEILLWDERLSSVSASRILSEQNIKAKNQKQLIDQVSACIILQNYMDYAQKNER